MIGKDERKKEKKERMNNEQKNSHYGIRTHDLLLCSPCLTHFRRATAVPPPDIFAHTMQLNFHDLTVAALSALAPPIVHL